MKLILHIGDHKTGSTSIQRALFESTWQSDAVTVAYPGTLNVNPLAKALYDDTGPQQRARLLDQTRDWLQAQTADMAVLSAEHFEFVKPQALRQAIDECLPAAGSDVVVIAYVRPHLGRLISSYVQRVKSRGYRTPFETFCTEKLNDGTFHYAPRFQAWRATFGDAFHLRPMVRDHLYQRDVVADFFKTVLNTEDFTVERVKQVNEAPTLDHLACLLRLHVVLRDAGHSKFTRLTTATALSEQLAKKCVPNGPRLQIPQSILEQVQEGYRADAETVDSSFLQGTPLATALAEAQGTTDPQPLTAKERFAPNVLRPLRQRMKSLSESLRANGDAWATFTASKRRADARLSDAEQKGVEEILSILDEICTILA